MREPPIERLNYFDGQRLQASDFRLEQEFHIRVQRWLTKSLFTPGIADGLEVVRKPETKSTIIVQPGLAIDDLGRAIILVEPEELVVTARFLTARYDEEKTAPLSDGCGAPGDDRALRWGGPSRIVSRPRFCFRDQIPRDSTRELVIAELELGHDCEIQRILVGSRRYAGVAQTSRTRAIAIEGEKDISDQEPKKLRFHIRNRRPEAVTLYLRGDRFSRTFYSELGSHDHTSSLDGTATTGPASKVDAHTHAHTLQVIGGAHSHAVHAPLSDRSPQRFGSGGLAAPVVYLPGIQHARPWALHVDTREPNSGVANANLAADVGLVVDPNVTLPSLSGTIGGVNSVSGPLHTHTFTGSISAAGAADAPAQPGSLGHFAGLEVFLGTQDITGDILAQAQREHPDQTWAGKLGDGTDTHPIVTYGTGPIRLDFIEGVDLVDGEYTLTFQLPAGTRNGGKLLYNLYVE